MWDKERDISIQVLDLMETDFIEIFRVKTWLLLLLTAHSRLSGWSWIVTLLTKLLHVEPLSLSPGPGIARLPVELARSFQYCAQTYTSRQHGGQSLAREIYTDCETQIQIFKLSTITIYGFWYIYGHFLRAKATVNCELFIEDLLSILTGPSLTLTIKSFSKFAGDTDTVMTYDTIRYEVGAHRTCSIHAVCTMYSIYTVQVWESNSDSGLTISLIEYG